MKPFAPMLSCCFLLATAACTRTVAPPSTASASQASGTSEQPVAPPAPPAPVPANTIPARFQGLWALDAAACAAPGHESRLVLAADRVQFHESSGPVRGVAANADDLVLTVALSGEGQTRQATYRYGLLGNGRTLVDRDGGMLRQRCDS